MLNPYAILAAIIFWLGSLASVGWWQHNAGRDAQKAADQVRFDKINADLTAQKTIAINTFQTAQATIIATLAERDKFKTKLETDHAKNIKTIDDLRNKYAGIGLRFAAPKDAGCWTGSKSPMPTAANPASTEPAPIVQLPDTIANDLRALVFDADKLAVEYKKCYEWAHHDIFPAINDGVSREF